MNDLALGVGVGAGLGLALVLLNRLALRRRLRTASAVLASYRDGDFSTRARIKGERGALREVLDELNELGERLRKERLGALEAWTLLRKVMSEVDVVVLGVRRGRGKRSTRERGRRARALGPAGDLRSSARACSARVLSRRRAARAARRGRPRSGAWELRRGTFRLSGEPHTLVVLSDVSSALRDNERDAWRRLIRVMGHEINNSLAPIRSLSEGLRGELGKTAADRSPSFESDLDEALGVIGRRSEALGRFIASYGRLARLPPPKLAPVELTALVAKVALLEQRVPPTVTPGPEVTVTADADQLEQVLINLLKNAAEATKGGVAITWTATPASVEIVIEDDGPGVSDTANLFVPFFTTKPDGSGIGLVLAREIVEAHKGQLTLASRPEGGAVARIRLPRAP